MTRTKQYVALGLACLAVIAAAQDKTVLRRTLTKDAEDVYKVELKGTSNASTDQGAFDLGMNGTMKYVFKTGAVTGEKADMDVSVKDIDVKVDGGPGGMPDLPKEVSFKAKMDTQNHLTDLDTKNMDPMMMMLASSSISNLSLFITFPDKGVSVGDTWDVVIPKNKFLGNEETKIPAKLVKEDSVDGKPVWVLSMEGDYSSKVKMADIIKGDNDGSNPLADATISGKNHIKMESTIDKATGKTLTNTFTQKMTGGKLESSAFQADLKGEYTIKMTLSK